MAKGLVGLKYLVELEVVRDQIRWVNLTRANRFHQSGCAYCIDQARSQRYISVP